MNHRPARPKPSSATPAQIPGLLRPEEWEDDISRNSLDDRPFVNLPTPCDQYEDIRFHATKHLPVELLDGRSLEDLVRRDSWPIPSPEDREGYCPGFHGVYWLSGLRDHLRIMEVVRRFNLDPRRYLDFGCASGRVLRHFCALTDIPEIWGSDINYRHIRWLQEHLPARVKAVFNHTIPALPLRDRSIDLLSAFSVFTHIDTFETAWLAELRRILRPGGIAYLTVHNEDTWRLLRESKNNRVVSTMMSVSPTIDDDLSRDLPEGRSVYRYEVKGPYRALVFHSNSYLNNVWGRFFDILEIIPRHHAMQTVVVARSPD